MKKCLYWTLGILLILSITSCNRKNKVQVVTKPQPALMTPYVNPFIGTGKHGHVFVGANVPFGFVQLGPTSISQQWDWTSGYHDSDSTVIGFPHTHLSGTGIGDLHDITLMPVTGEVKYARGNEKDPTSGLWSYSDRSRQVCHPGYFATHLQRYDIDVELTCTQRVGFHKYTFPASSESAVVFDLENGGCWDQPVEAYIRKLNDRTLEGFRYSKGWAPQQRIYFYAEFSQPITSLEGMVDGEAKSDLLWGKVVYGRANLKTTAGEPVYVKVALSPTSISNAKQNMIAELPEWDFYRTADRAEKSWNTALHKIDIKTQNEKVKKIFYTALYHTMVAPSLYCDVNGNYYGADGRIHFDGDFTNYTTLSCWDTYRAFHPLMTIIHPERMKDMMKTFLQIEKEQGKLPVWHLMGNETNCMVGNPSINIVADGLLKGFIDDKEAAYEALKRSAMLDERGMDLRKKWGYIPSNKMKESVAYDMEYAIADGSIAKVAKLLNKEEDYDYFTQRSHSYRQLFDKKLQFVRGKETNKRFSHPFNPYASSHRNDDYCEGNAWQYTFLVPHDIEGLTECFGGKRMLIKKLDSLFTVKSEVEGAHHSPDISGMIGQYAHGNEPSHHIAYLYSMLGQPEKTAKYVRQIMSTLYNDNVDGLCGNEDVGALSAWYVLSALGLYQVDPAGGRYVFGSPIVDQATLQVRDGIFQINVYDNSEDNKYIQEVRLNRIPLRQYWIDYEDIAKGGTLEIFMGFRPRCWYEVEEDEVPTEKETAE